VTDRRIARIVKATQDLPGQQLFQYVDEEGERRQVTSNDVNAYIRAAAEVPFSSKHVRTCGGTVQALRLFSELEPPATKRGLAVATNRVIDAVSGQLGNTRAVCRKCYVHPLVLARWQEGRLTEELAAVRRRFRRAPAGLGRGEYIALRWLQTASEET
jgi:DNA topoisomerase-1